MQPMVNIALRGARAAGEQITRSIERLDLIKSEQSSVIEYIEDTCKQAERTIVNTIHKAYPDHQVNCEYTGTHKPEDKVCDVIWSVNPIDSISNFSNALPVFAMSIACHQRGKLEHAIILNPITGEEFTASRGRGAQLNGKRLRVSNRKLLDNALIGSGFFARSSDKAHLDSFQQIFKSISLESGRIHSGGSPALNLAYTAAGRLDGFFQIGLKQSEMEAGTLMIQEAGGLLSDFTGNNNYMSSGNLVVGNPKMLKALLQVIRPALNDELK
ncbi:inositol monophosphatase family protein [Amphritea sp. 1_MG-2023]|uniref:inositol monophosphatase family protein n=1 Tax=Amphritea sp. 1_MG-2023 TaxID=3062670 RepID=UPI0026E24A2E|nr:inositol monophosphatase family protein [Amphritea sp. 1_MG-2023]MDO6564857.1 inositol monophosphatase family protein [Amphritea sp. 1_MG-2023]